MAGVFLDTNILVDYFERLGWKNAEHLDKSDLFVSVLSVHILAYSYKYKIPDDRIDKIFKAFNLVDFDKVVLVRASQGPTEDLEDNIQLHSAVAVDCDVFLTSDRKLLKLGYFGKVRICDRLSL